MATRRKLDWNKINANLNGTCPHCGATITPEERKHVDMEHLECQR
jgi:hypothetical protein